MSVAAAAASSFAAFAVSTPRDGRGALSVECEWALSLARDLPAGRAYTEDEVAAAVASVHACIEVCGTRFGASAQPAAPAGRAIIADHAGNETIAVTGALPCDVRALAEWCGDCAVAVRWLGAVLRCDAQREQHVREDAGGRASQKKRTFSLILT